MVRLSSPIVAAEFRVVVAKEKFYFRLFRRGFESGLELRIVKRPDGVKLVLIISRDHVHIDVQQDRLLFHRQIRNKMPSPQQPSLLSVERHEDQRMVRLMLFEIRSDRKPRRRARSTIVRTVIDLAVSDPVVVIVSGNNDVLIRGFLSLYLPDKMYAFKTFARATLLYVEFLLVRLQT